MSTQKIMKLWGKKTHQIPNINESSLAFSRQSEQRSIKRNLDLLSELENMPKNQENDMLLEVLKKMPLEDFMNLTHKIEQTQHDNYLENVYLENASVNKHKYLLPPFLIRSEEEKKLSKLALKSSSHQTNDSDYSDQYSFNEELDAFVKKNWKPNVTILDYDWHAANGDSRVELGWDIGETLNSIFKNETKSNMPQNPKSIFDWYAFYFYSIAKSLKFLINDKNMIELEGRIGDVNGVFSNLYLEMKQNNLKENIDDNKFNRIFLSNIPDYHSFINVFTECLPILKSSPCSFIKSTVLMNTGMWANYEHYIYSGSLLKSLNQAESILNASKIKGDLWGSDPLWSHATSNFKPPYKARDEVLNWLTRVLLTFAFPARRDSTNCMRETYSPNLVVFFRSIQYLIWLSYPKHWFQTYLKSVIENKLISCENFPSESPNKCKLVNDRTPRRIELSTILMEIHTLSSIYMPLLEIGGLNLPTSVDSIYEYEIKFNCFMPFYQNGLPYSDVLSLVLENSFTSISISTINENVRGELLKQSSNGKKHLFSVMKFSSTSQTAHFFMNTQDFDSMTAKKEKWYMSLIRTDSWERISLSEELSKAKLIKKFI